MPTNEEMLLNLLEKKMIEWRRKGKTGSIIIEIHMRQGGVGRVFINEKGEFFPPKSANKTQ